MFKFFQSHKLIDTLDFLTCFSIPTGAVNPLVQAPSSGSLTESPREPLGCISYGIHCKVQGTQRAGDTPVLWILTFDMKDSVSPGSFGIYNCIYFCKQI